MFVMECRTILLTSLYRLVMILVLKFIKFSFLFVPCYNSSEFSMYEDNRSHCCLIMSLLFKFQVLVRIPLCSCDLISSHASMWNSNLS